MTRTRALEFIRENSRILVRLLVNPIDKEDEYDSYTPMYFEHRIGSNGTPFILQDCGKNGWDIFFLVGGNEVKSTIIKFAEKTGVNEELQLVTH